MKGKRKTFRGFFFSAFVGFLAFCIAAMAGFTYLAAQRQRDMDIVAMQTGASGAASSVGQAQRSGEINTDQERFTNTLRGMLARKYYAGKTIKAELALLDADGEPVVATENYWDVHRDVPYDNGLHSSEPCYLDLDRWLTAEEQRGVIEQIIADWNKDMWGSYAVGDIDDTIRVDGWLDGAFVIPRKIYAEGWKVTNVYAHGRDFQQTPEKIVLFDRVPEGIDTDNLDYQTEMDGGSDLLGGLTDRGSGPLEMSYEEFAARRDDPDRKALRERIQMEKPQESGGSVLEPKDELESLWRLQMIFYRQPTDSFGSALLDSPYTIVYGAVSYPLKTAAKQLAPVYGLCFVMVLALSLLLAWRLNRVWQKQDKLERVRRETTSALAHELKTPLAVLSASAELLQSDMAAEKQAHYLSVIRAQAARMDDSVRKMLDLSRLEAGAEHLHREPLALAALARDMLRAAAPLTEGVETRVVSDGTDQATADRALLTRALDSLLGNAIRFTPKGGRITVHIANGVCAVENTGEPIAEQDFPRLWDAYFQADPARSDKGTGLGLAIAKAVFELHGYPFGAENSADGPRFWFRFRNN